MAGDFVVKDSGNRQEFDSGMVRDTEEGKLQWHRIFEGPMARRWAEHLTKGAAKYPDSEDGTANWTKAAGEVERRRFRRSALRHFLQWYFGEKDEDHAAAVFFNINGAEYVLDQMGGPFAPGEYVELPPGKAPREFVWEPRTQTLVELVDSPSATIVGAEPGEFLKRGPVPHTGTDWLPMKAPRGLHDPLKDGV